MRSQGVYSLVIYHRPTTAKRTTIYSSPCERSTGLCPIYSEANYHLQLALRAIYRALPDLQRSELPSTARPASDLLSPATNSLLTTVDIRLIYGTYTVDTRYISIFTP